MTRPLRLQYCGALYHVTSRGDRREDIYHDAHDREIWLDVLGHVCDRHNWVVHCYCLMTNHYHLLVETPDGNLSVGMRQLNGQYSRNFNRRHDLVGHLFQGRYKAILVQKESYLLELTRYIVLNPLRAKMVEKIEDWPWSSYPATVGLASASDWLDSDWILSQFHKQRSQAVSAYNDYIQAGLGQLSPLSKTRYSLLLGDNTFVERHCEPSNLTDLRETSKAHKRALALPLEEYCRRYPDRDEAMARAYLSGVFTMAEIGRYFGVHYMTVSRAVRDYEVEKVGTNRLVLECET